MKQHFDRVIQDNKNGLTLDRIVAEMPTIAAQTAHKTRSEKYLMIPTIDIAQDMLNLGYVVTAAMRSLSRLPDGNNHARHLLRFRQEKYFGIQASEAPDLVLTNDSMGRGAYLLMLGIINFLCDNGLVVGDMNTTLRVLHKGNVLENVRAASVKIAEEAETTMRVVAQMKAIGITPQERLTLATYAASERFNIPVADLKVVDSTLAYNPHDLLRPRMGEDINTLWGAYNAIEYNAMTGGVVNHQTHRQTHVVSAIPARVSFETKLWQFADEIRKIKVG